MRVCLNGTIAPSPRYSAKKIRCLVLISRCLLWLMALGTLTPPFSTLTPPFPKSSPERIPGQRPSGPRLRNPPLYLCFSLYIQLHQLKKCSNALKVKIFFGGVKGLIAPQEGSPWVMRSPDLIGRRVSMYPESAIYTRYFYVLAN